MVKSKVCSKCKKRKLRKHFKYTKLYTNGLYCWCFDCSRKQGRDYRKRNRKRLHRKWKKWIAVPGNREKYNAARRRDYHTPWGKYRRKDSDYRRKYGVTLERFNKIAKRQKYKCKICKERRRLAADHNHKTGKFRGAICIHCNVIIGRIDRNPILLKNLQKYLKGKQNGSGTLHQ